MTRITIGQYYPTNSPIHRVDSRVKLIAAFAHITAVLLVNNFIGYGVVALYVLGVIWASRVPFMLILRGLRAIIFILMFAVAINLFFAPGYNVLFHFGFLRITTEGLIHAAQMALRLTLLITGTSILTLTTSPIRLTDGIESLLRPLKIIKVPAHDIAMMMTIALRFIPTLADEMQKIMKAQKARGADFDTGNLLQRGKSLLPVLVPLFVSSFKRAEELATAMEARCYRGDIGRTKMNPMKMTPADILSLGVILLVTAVTILTRWIMPFLRYL